jgi:hypothetical protein
VLHQGGANGGGSGYRAKALKWKGKINQKPISRYELSAGQLGLCNWLPI